MVCHEGLENGIRVLAARQHAGIRRNAQRHEAIGHWPFLLRYALQRLAHELDPDRQRRLRALLGLAERALLIEADPHGADEILREAVEPGVLRLVRRARLA